MSDQQHPGQNVPPPPYYQQYPNTQGPAVPPPRKPSFWRRKVGCLPMWALIALAIVAVASIGAITNTVGQPPSTSTPVPQGNTSTQPAATATPAPTQAPTHAPAKWTMTHTFKGVGSKKTGVISVPSDWKIVWSCDPTSFDNINFNMIITVYNSDGSYADSGVNSTCTKTNTHDETEEHQSGNVYLDVTSEGSWTIQVQELK